MVMTSMKLAGGLAFLSLASAFSPSARAAAELKWRSPTGAPAASSPALPEPLPNMLGGLAGVSLAALALPALTGTPAPSVFDTTATNALSFGNHAAVVVLPLALAFMAQQYLAAPGEAEAAAEDEACIVADEEPVCGKLSFDSGADMVCVETYDAEGKLRWACA